MTTTPSIVSYWIAAALWTVNLDGMASEMEKITATVVFSAEGEPTGTLVEYFADAADIERSSGWEPDSSHSLTSLASLIETAKKTITQPEGKYPYLDPELVGADLRRPETHLWYWEIHFLFRIDFDSIEGLAPRGGERYESVALLPNGGLITVRQRDMTVEERITYGVDPNLNEKDPFEP